MTLLFVSEPDLKAKHGALKTTKKPPATPKLTKVTRVMASVVESGLDYLDTRSTFWRQQMPLHLLDSMLPPVPSAMSSKQADQSRGANATEASDASERYTALLADIMKCNEGMYSGLRGTASHKI